MKKTVKILSAVMCAVMLMLSLASCGVIRGDTVMEYEGYKITEAMYSYWKSRYKAVFVSNYGTTGSDGKKTIDWSAKLPDGSTYEQFFEEFVNTRAKKVLISQKLFDDYNLSFTEEQEQTITDAMEGLTNTYGGKKELNTYLSAYGLNTKTLESIYYAEAKVDIVADYIFGASGPYAVTTAEEISYYQSNYYCVNKIYIYTKKKPSEEAGGNNADGSYIMVDIEEPERSQKEQLVKDILAKLQAGEKFTELKAAHCEGKANYLSNGFNLSANDYGSYGVDFVKHVQSMNIGDITTFEDEYGTQILVRNPLTDYTALEAAEKSVMVGFDDYVKQEKWEKLIAEFKIEIDNDVIARYKPQTVKPFTNLAI